MEKVKKSFRYWFSKVFPDILRFHLDLLFISIHIELLGYIVNSNNFCFESYVFVFNLKLFTREIIDFRFGESLKHKRWRKNKRQ